MKRERSLEAKDRAAGLGQKRSDADVGFRAAQTSTSTHTSADSFRPNTVIHMMPSQVEDAVIPILGERQFSGNLIALLQEAGRTGLNVALGNHSPHRRPVPLVRT